MSYLKSDYAILEKSTEQHVEYELDSNAGKQLSLVATDVQLTLVLKK